MVEYKWIEGEHSLFNEVAAVIEANKWTPLNRKTTRVLVAIDDGQLIGFHVAQLFPHCEPLWVSPERRGEGDQWIAGKLAAEMFLKMRDFNVRGYMVIADNPVAQRLCEAYGMTKVSSPVYMM